MAGRKPKPTSIKKLEGNPGKRQLNTKGYHIQEAVADMRDLFVKDCVAFLIESDSH